MEHKETTLNSIRKAKVALEETISGMINNFEKDYNVKLSVRFENDYDRKENVCKTTIFID